jgi:hypothetical protein
MIVNIWVLFISEGPPHIAHAQSRLDLIFKFDQAIRVNGMHVAAVCIILNNVVINALKQLCWSNARKPN